MATLFSAFVILYGIAGAASSLLQLRRMRSTRSSDDVSIVFLAGYCGGYVVWFSYGLVYGLVPPIVVNTLGIAVSGMVVYTAVRLRMVEKGQTLGEALREERVGVTDRVWWLAPDPASKPTEMPGFADELLFSRWWPNQAPPPPRRGFEELEPDAPDAVWRAWDSGDVGNARWREALVESYSRLPTSWKERPAARAAAVELARAKDAAPAIDRIALCRTVAMAADLVAEREHHESAEALSLISVVDRQLRVSASAFNAPSHRWVDQTIASLSLSRSPESTLPPSAVAAVEALSARGLVSRVPLRVAPDRLLPRLLPASTGAGYDSETPDPLVVCPVYRRASEWQTTRTLALASRPRDLSRLSLVHPLDRLLSEAWVVERLHDLIPAETAERSWIVERGLLRALLTPADARVEDLDGIDVSDTADTLAAAVGIAFTTLERLVERQYLNVLRSLGESPADWRVVQAEHRWHQILQSVVA